MENSFSDVTNRLLVHFWMKLQCCNLLLDKLLIWIFLFSRTTSKKCLGNGKVLMMRYGPKSSYLSEIEEWLKPTLEHQSLLSMAAMKDSMDLGMYKIIKRHYIWNFVSKISLNHCTISQSFWCSHEVCSCPLLWYFGTLFCDDITGPSQVGGPGVHVPPTFWQIS